MSNQDAPGGASKRWLRPRYGQAPNNFHAERVTHDGSVQTECDGRWSASEVTDCLDLDGVSSGAYATEKCKACVDIVERKRGAQ